MSRWAGAMAAVLMGSAPAWAQDSPPRDAPQDPPASTLEDVIVSGRTLEEQARRFVDEIAQPVQRRGLARWDGPACFGVVNFGDSAARGIADQLLMRADELGLPAAGEGCQPNVFIIGATDAADVAAAWVARSPDVFQPGFSGAAARPGVLEHFVSSDAAVRWWHLSIPMHFDVFTGTSQRAVRLPGEPPPWLRVYSKSQHASRIRDDLLKVMMLVDVDRLGSVTTEQLCDYLLMVAFAQIDPQGDTRAFETILNVFDDPSTPGLTHWDRSYLSALYEGDAERRVSRGDQGRRLVNDLREEDTGAGQTEPGR